MLENKINGKIYIGQTIRPIEKRLEEHRTGKSKNCRLIYRAIKKYGWENFEKDYYECPDEDLNFDEDLLVSEMGTLSPNGYNLKEGGGNRGKLSEESKQKMSEANIGEKNHNYGKTPSEETKQKMSEANLGKTHSDETKQKMREAKLGKKCSDETKQKIREAKLGDKNHNYGKTPSEETKQKMREAHLGKTHSEETKQKLREANIGKTHSENHPMFGKTPSKETKQKMREAQIGEKNHSSKRVYQYDLEGTFVNSFGSVGEAERHLKKDRTHISSCARGERKTAQGFKWSYEESFVISNI